MSSILRYNGCMSKSTTRYGGYRREYSAELRASMAKCSNSSGHRRHHLGVALATLLVVLASVSAVGVVYLNRYEPEATAKAAPSAKLLTTTDKSVDAKTTTIIPYNTTIGFVGDSLTFGCCTDSTPAPEIEMDNLGDNYRAINRGVNGSTTRDWLNNLLEPALAEFRDNNVEVVQVMLGTNDVAANIPTDEIVDNLRAITDKLLENGAKVVIVNKVPYSLKHNDLAIRRLNVALDELPNGAGVYLGDDQSYDYFRQHQDQLEDGLHMNQEGYEALADLWIAAFKRILVETPQVGHSLTTTNYQIGSGAEFVYSVNKSAKWFVAGMGQQSGVLIDDQLVDANQYDVTRADDQISIKLHTDYLDSLSTTEHSIAVRYIDGTSFATSFTVTKSAE